MLSDETRGKIDKFAVEQAGYYLDDAEKTYIEKLKSKGITAKNKLQAKAAKFKLKSASVSNAKNDMVEYMTDYINDLTAGGMDESEAYLKAAENLKYDGQKSEQGFAEKFNKYYEEMSPAAYEAIGLYYGAFVIIGLIFGAVCGAALAVYVFNINAVAGAVSGALAGLFLGAACGMLKHASIANGK